MDKGKILRILKNLEENERLENSIKMKNKIGTLGIINNILMILKDKNIIKLMEDSGRDNVVEDLKVMRDTLIKGEEDMWEDVENLYNWWTGEIIFLKESI